MPKIIVGDALSVLRTLPSESAQVCVTSPPYWGTRDYGLDGQVGAEKSIDEYIATLRNTFRQVRRVLKKDGALWLNIGDVYTSGNRGWRAPDRRNPSRAMSRRPATPRALKSKELVGAPWKLAFALQRQGWYLRSDVIWFKPNAQPESVKDRPSRAHEYLFLLTKTERYYYDYEAGLEASNGGGLRNRRSVWSVKQRNNGLSHPAAFPPELIRPCILMTSRPGDLILDPYFGTGTVGEVSISEGRDFLGIELSPKYASEAGARLGLTSEALEVRRCERTGHASE